MPQELVSCTHRAFRPVNAVNLVREDFLRSTFFQRPSK